MSNEVIFWTQIASIVAFVLSVFGLYRLLVDQKYATIQLLKETVNTLKYQLAEALALPQMCSLNLFPAGSSCSRLS